MSNSVDVDQTAPREEKQMGGVLTLGPYNGAG